LKGFVTLMLSKADNPLFLETYELERPEFRFVAEQVSHHPPTSAFHAESEDFEFYGTVSPKVKFSGFYVDCKPNASFTLKFKNRNETYTWSTSNAVIKNLFFGQMYMSLTSNILIQSHAHELQLLLDFERVGRHGPLDRLVVGTIRSLNGSELRIMYGNYTSYLAVCDTPTLFESAFSRFMSAFERVYDSEEKSAKLVLLNGSRVVWHCFKKPPMSEEFYKLTYFSLILNEVPNSYAKLPPTDSRRRPDIRLMDEGNIEQAAEEKSRLEIKQRALSASLKRSKGTMCPRWFTYMLPDKDEYGREGEWRFERKYWDRNFGDCAVIF